ncbi:MAG: porin [Firmicutes bacterium]|nr:porin [Bacillota bacterium]
MNIRFALVASAVALALPLSAADLQVAPGTTFSVTGFFGLGLKQASISNSVRPGLSTETRLDDNTSRLFFTGSAKIMDGWNVVFTVGSRFTTDVRPADAVLSNVTASNSLTVSQATGWADDDTWAGILSPYGRLIMGKNSFYWSDTIGLPHIAPVLDAPGECYRVWDANGLATFNILNQAMSLIKSGILVNNYTLGITRSRNVVRYDSPNWSGVDLAVLWSKNPIGNELWWPGFDTPGTSGTTNYARNYADGNTTYLRLRYNGKGMSLFGSMLNQKIQGGVYNTALYGGPQDVSAYRLGASYKFPFGTKVGVVYDHTSIANGVAGTALVAYTGFNTTTNTGIASVIMAPGSITTGDASRNAYEITVSHPFKDFMAHVTYAKAGNMASVASTGANQLNLAVDYALTKRTFVGLQYSTLKNDSNGHYSPFLTNFSFGATAPNTPAGYNGENWSQLSLNLQFWF